MSLDDVIKPLNRVDKAIIIRNAERNPNLQTKAKKEAEKLVKSYLGEVPYQIKDDEGNFRTLKSDELDALDEERRSALVNEVMNVMPEQSMEQAIIQFSKDSKNPENLDSKYMGPAQMASIIVDQEVREGVKIGFAKDDKDGKKNYGRIADEYSQVIGLKGLAKRVEEGKTIAPEQREQLNELIVKGVIKKNSDEFKKKGYTDAVAAAAGKLSALVYQVVGDQTKMLKLGIELSIKEAEKKLKKLSSGYVEVLAKAVGKYLAKEMKSSEVSGTPENPITAPRRVMNLLYNAKNDNKYGFGTREFEVAFAA